MITAAKFKKATGRAPKDDDLERCNCPLAGTTGHTDCGWNHDMGLPVYEAKAEQLRRSLEQQRENLKKFVEYGHHKQHWTGFW